MPQNAGSNEGLISKNIPRHIENAQSDSVNNSTNAIEVEIDIFICIFCAKNHFVNIFV